MIFPLIEKIKLKYFPSLIWNAIRNNSAEYFARSKFILSFDCDTEEDIAVAWEVHQRLMDINIMPVYAVPGELLQKGEKVYRKLNDTGAEFINHGGREHTYFDQVKGRHASCFFYEQQSKEVLHEDILLGHKILKEVLGVQAKGWRTPHFGTFQQPDHLQFLYSVLNELNYEFSTSTVPRKMYNQGPIIKGNSIIEIPVTGTWSEPLNILDTWAFFGAPDRQKGAKEYYQECVAVHNYSTQHPILINIYGDPSHIHNEPLFFDSMKLLADGTQNCNFSDLLKDLQ